jgi:hypothetical protein
VTVNIHCKATSCEVPIHCQEIGKKKKNLPDAAKVRRYKKTEKTEDVRHVHLLSIQNKSLAQEKKIFSPQTCVTDDLQQFAASVQLNQQCRTTNNSDVISKQ